ncbi:MAG TPA: Mut7-C RNAse domain-containing protein [Syntrophales bacterium]|nr:Mut7-C RNAse domain-containing protein [Syntrophales bacterium]
MAQDKLQGDKIPATSDPATWKNRTSITRFAIRKAVSVSRRAWAGHLKRGILADGRINSFRPASTDPDEQIVELLRVFSLEGRIRPFTRCLECNTPLRQAAAEAVRDLVPPGVFTVTDEFCRCPTCGRVYWPGSHYEGMKGRIGRWLSTCRGEALPLFPSRIKLSKIRKTT